jgi:PhzF family phenazine biosynthesis protein
MNNAPIYQVDAFTDTLFGGNPAAVCLLDRWPEDEMLQNIALENNLSETAFLVKNHQGFDIRWFTPVVEVDLCGHATLAAAHVLFHIRNYTEHNIHFESRSGTLIVSNDGDKITLDFPADPPADSEHVPGLLVALGLSEGKIMKGKTDLMVVVSNQDLVQSLSPDFYQLAKLDVRGVIVTAPGHEVDFVSRFFAPASGIDEDPVTGSAHCSMTPYWSNRLGKTKLKAIQLSPRGGSLQCELAGQRVKISGAAVTYLTGLVNY